MSSTSRAMLRKLRKKRAMFITIGTKNRIRTRKREKATTMRIRWMITTITMMRKRN